MQAWSQLMRRVLHRQTTFSVSQKRTVRAFRRGSHPSSQFDNSTLGLREISSVLSEPTWSVRSLLPSYSETVEATEVSSKQLHHLLRLSALPPPKDQEEEENMLKTLSSQLLFVKEIQNVDTTGVIPLQSIRDETAEAESENEITMDKLEGALAEEEAGINSKKRTRRILSVDTQCAEDWDPLAHTSRKLGRFFVVETGKGQFTDFGR
ncbi:MAG: hypothetical protein M1835_006112 [Candelina submexicana]|nr:MAG: hypothetical protein M1835_006112 [Candelina submexicana]